MVVCEGAESGPCCDAGAVSQTHSTEQQRQDACVEAKHGASGWMEETRAFPSHGCPRSTSKVGKVHELVYITDSEYVREGCSLQCFDACEAFALDVQSLGGETCTEEGSVQR